MLIEGIIQVTGPSDVGKTTFALECGAEPSRILLVDDDIKGRATVKQIEKDIGKFGRYVDFVEDAKGRSLLDIHVRGMDIISSIKPGEFDAIVWDTWSRFGSTFVAFVRKNLSRFRAPGEWSQKGAIKGPEQWKEAQLYEATVLNHLQSLAKCVILVTHIKNFYSGGVKTNKQIPDSSRTLNRIPVMRLWLIHNPSGSPVPVALVLKRPSIKKFVKSKGLRTINILPRKITPSESDQSLWDTIASYYDNPMDRHKPQPDETPDEFQLSILDGTLTKEQQATLKLSLRIKAQELEDEAEIAEATEKQELITKVKDLSGDGLSKAKIAKQLKISVKEVREILKEAK